MKAYINSSIIIGLIYKILNYYKNSLTSVIFLKLGIIFKNSRIYGFCSDYLEKTPKTKYSITYRLIANLFGKLDKIVGLLNKYTKESLIYNFFHTFFVDSKKNYKAAISTGILFFIIGYCIMTTKLGYWSITKLLFIAFCFSAIVFVNQTVNVALWYKNSILFKSIKFLEE